MLDKRKDCAKVEPLRNYCEAAGRGPSADPAPQRPARLNRNCHVMIAKQNICAEAPKADWQPIAASADRGRTGLCRLVPPCTAFSGGGVRSWNALVRLSTPWNAFFPFASCGLKRSAQTVVTLCNALIRLRTLRYGPGHGRRLDTTVRRW